MEGGQRIDKWLFFARLTKSRNLAQGFVQSGAVRLNREKIDQPSKAVRPGDVLTMSLHGRIRVIKIRAPGMRRGPASEASQLYEDLSPPPEPATPEAQSQPILSGRPSARDAAEARRLKRGD